MTTSIRRQEAAETSERVRRLALGLTAALVTARAFWPSEPDLREGAGSGIYWVFAGLHRVRTGADVGPGRRPLSLPLVVDRRLGRGLDGSWSPLSASHALDRRPAINLAWEWVALGLVYLLLRNLPRTRDESSALAGVMVATAFAVSVYGLYQVTVELPLIRAEYLRNPGPMLQRLGIEPGGRGEELLRNRLVGSTEVFSTFGLANSLAGFVVGPLVLALAVGISEPGAAGRAGIAMGRARRWRPRSFSFSLVCLILTKSRSAWLGLWSP